MKKLLYLGLLAGTVLFTGACTSSEEGQEETLQAGVREGEGGHYYGGVLRINESEYIKNLFPPSITDVYSYRVASQMYEGLFKFNDLDLTLENSLAESYTLDSTGTVYTFKLRDNVYFHDDPAFPGGKGRKLTAADVAFCFTQLCTQSALNQNYSVFAGLLKGADAYFKASAGGKTPSFGVEGIEVLDSLTLRLSITKPNSVFLVNLARPATFIYPPEALEEYGPDMRIRAVGTGAFEMGNVEENISIVLPKNPNYWGEDHYGNPLPFLDAVNVQFINSKKSELFEFKKGNLDMIYRLPTEHIIEILESNLTGNGEFNRYELQREPEMVTQFLTFNTANRKLFSNPDLRKAISYAIDRDKILTFVLNNEGFAPGHHGITPPVFTDYNISEIPGYRLNVDSARYYLTKAGYPNGKGFPKVEFMLNAEGDRNTNVAVEIQKQLSDHLNIQVEIATYPFAQLLENAYQGRFDVMRSAWYADFPSPENFLWVFYSGNMDTHQREPAYPNIARYSSAKFNKLYEQALRARSVSEANKYFIEAEKVLMEDAPIIVLWYDEGFRLLQSYVKNFPNNPMQYRDFSKVYFQQARKLRSQ
ncbi:ABC transporter substrate-binding protein [Nafulsella turpanensis]|uniref:ABC transporter substrate-binding protein n=1 Tax=Nafulsella turpanensis TaxID=1265690 RepID=UPI00034D5434|nr:ABC transporter substrate-binding protein [Nafulsella turpanensis]